MNQTMKKITAMALSAATCLCLFAGCGSKTETPAASAAPAANTPIVETQAPAVETSAVKAESQSVAPAPSGIPVEVNSDCEQLSQEQTQELVSSLYSDYFMAARNDPERIQETTFERYTLQCMGEDDTFDVGHIIYNGYDMRYGCQVIGEPDDNGCYPLYIVLHGGGASDAWSNDEQWEEMFYYYRDSVENGLYVNVRGIADTWNTHFLDESYYMYDRLIEDMILFKNADPNRVYVLGFSAGGDGVYAVTTHMADRIAAGNMSSGHPNGISLRNLSNLPILLQAGIRDNWYNRNTVTVESGWQLDDYAVEYGFGYEHQVLIHVPEGHNYTDDDPDADSTQTVIADIDEYMVAMNENEELAETVGDEDIAYSMDEDVNEVVADVVYEAGLETTEVDSNAVRWVSQYSRDPFPANLVWDLDTRAGLRTVQSFYFLKAPAETTGVLVASYDALNNAITIDASGVNGDFSILFNPFMLDLSQPVQLTVDGVTFLVNVAPSEDCINASLAENADLYRVSVGEISYNELMAYAG